MVLSSDCFKSVNYLPNQRRSEVDGCRLGCAAYGQFSRSDFKSQHIQDHNAV